MSGNSIGRLFSVTTFGESHGVALGCTVDGCPPGLSLVEADIQAQLDKRKPGQSRYGTQRKEGDRVEILSGVFEGKTTGTPIGLLIRNEDQKSKDYEDIKHKFRPGHADFTYYQKYGFRDYRGGGRASARETCMRVAAGAIAKKYLEEVAGIEVIGYLEQMGDICIEEVNLDEIDRNPFFCPDASKISAMENLIDALRKQGDSVGAAIKIIARGVTPGLGEPVFDKLDADLAAAMMSINAVKAVEIGAGIGVVQQRGSEHRDEIRKEGFLTNNAGGILGGISSGQDIEIRISLKPTSSIMIPGLTLDQDGNETEIVTKGRHDPCVGVRAAPIAEAMMSIVLMDHYLRQRALKGILPS